MAGWAQNFFLNARIHMHKHAHVHTIVLDSSFHTLPLAQAVNHGDRSKNAPRGAKGISLELNLAGL